MRETVMGYEIVSAPDPPEGLLKVLSDGPAKASFTTYRLSSGTKRLAFVGSAVSAVLTHMLFADAPMNREFMIGSIMSGLRASMTTVAKALLFMYEHNLVCEIRYDDGRKAYVLTNAGCVLAGDVADLEGDFDYEWPVGIAILGDGELKPILLCPCPMVKLEKGE